MGDVLLCYITPRSACAACCTDICEYTGSFLADWQTCGQRLSNRSCAGAVPDQVSSLVRRAVKQLRGVRLCTEGREEAATHLVLGAERRTLKVRCCPMGPLRTPRPSPSGLVVLCTRSPCFRGDWRGHRCPGCSLQGALEKPYWVLAPRCCWRSRTARGCCAQSGSAPRWRRGSGCRSRPSRPRCVPALPAAGQWLRHAVPAQRAHRAVQDVSSCLWPSLL